MLHTIEKQTQWYLVNDNEGPEADEADPHRVVGEGDPVARGVAGVLWDEWNQALCGILLINILVGVRRKRVAVYMRSVCKIFINISLF